MKLYSYWRSSAAYRVRIGLNLKGLKYETVPVHLVRDGGEQRQSAYHAVNPQGLVPALESEGQVLTQSLAILEYLDERFPDPPLLPGNPVQRAATRAIALAIACDIHPLCNLRVQQYLTDSLSIDATARNKWSTHWITNGFAAIETVLAQHRHGNFCMGHAPTLADVCLVPQLYNARRLKIDLCSYPVICDIDANCAKLDVFLQAAPENQPDALLTEI